MKSIRKSKFLSLLLVMCLIVGMTQVTAQADEVINNDEDIPIPEITIVQEPSNITVTQGAITEKLSVTATTSNNAPISYQWADENGEPISGEIGPEFVIPTGLEAGTYYYYCVLSAEGCADKFSIPVRVSVESNPECSHEFGTDLLYDETNHWHQCSCGEKAEVAAHTSGEWGIIVEPTETTIGMKQKRCTVCNWIIMEEEIPTIEAEGNSLATYDEQEINTPQGLNDALKSTTASIINVTADLALLESVTLGASHTLHIEDGKTVVTKGDFSETLKVPSGMTLTLTGPGTLKANNTANGSIGIFVEGILKLEPGSRLEAANTGTVGVHVDYSEGKLISNGGLITVSGSGDVGIAGNGDGEVKIAGGSLVIKNTDGIGVSAGAIHISDGCEVIIDSESTGIFTALAEIKDSMVSISNTKGKGIQLIKNGDMPNGLTISNCTVDIANKSGNGIESGVAISLVNKTVVNIKNTAAMGLRFTDALLIDDARINTANSGGTMLTLSRKVSGANSGTINLVEGAIVAHPRDCMSDRGVSYQYAGNVTVTAGEGPPSDERITAGEYIWDGEYFLKSGIVGMTLSPENPTVQAGNAFQFTATVEGAGNYSEEVDWATSCTSCTISDGLLMVCSDVDHSSNGISVTVTSQEDNTISATTVVTVEKADQLPPQAPIEIRKTSTSVTLDQVAGVEYSNGGTIWQSSNEFTGLTPNTRYSFYARLKETSTHLPSAASHALIIVTDKEELTGTISITGTAKFGETLTADLSDLPANLGTLTYSWKRGQTEIGTSSTYKVKQADIGNTVTVIVTAENYKGSIESRPTSTIAKGDQFAPELMYNITDEFPKTLTITEVVGAEYSFDGLSYSTINTFISEKEEDITLYIRMAATDTHNSSSSASLTINSGNQPQKAPPTFILEYKANSDINYTVTIPIVEGAEYSFDGSTYGAENTITANAGDIVTGYIRLAAKPGYNASDAVSASVTLPLFVVAAPTANPNGGSFVDSLRVTLTSTTPGATIYYTTDGITPTMNSLQYNSAILLSQTTTIKAIAVKPGMTNSEVLILDFTLEEAPETDIIDINYPITTDFGVWKGIGEISATIDADYTKFLSLLYEGQEVDSSFYTITPGSTVITLKEDYLKTLGEGDHTYVAEFTDGISDKIKLTVEKTENSNNSSSSKGSSINSNSNTTSPRTGDNAQIFLWLLLGATLVGIFSYPIMKRKRNKI